MKKQKLALIIALILGLMLLTLSGCGGGGGGGGTEPTTPADPVTDPITDPADPDDTENKDPLARFEIEGLDFEQPGRPAVAYNDIQDEFLVVSATTAADGTSKLVGIIQSPPFDGTNSPNEWPITIADLQVDATSSRPAAIFNGTHYCIVFQDGGNIYAQLIDTVGNLLGTKQALSSGEGNYLPVMAYDDQNDQALVVWVKYMDESVNYYDLYSALVSFDNLSGNIAKERLEESLLGSQAGDQNEPAVSFDGDNYLVLWRQSPDTSEDITLTSDIYGARVGATNGTVVGDTFPVATAAGGQAEPQLAFDGTNYLAVWSDLRNATTTGYDIYGAIISPTDAPNVDANFPINDASVDIQNFPTVSWSGDGFVVAWANLDLDYPTNIGIFANIVTSAGEVTDQLFEVSGAAEGTLNIYPVASEILVTWVSLQLGS